jgi:polar amino acid transport system substrate-binding protein
MHSAEPMQALAAKGVLRAGINLGNPILAQKSADGTLGGVSVELARTFAETLGGRVEFVTYDGAGKVVAAAGHDVWDVAFLAVDPERARDLAYTDPYVTIEGVFVVPENSMARRPLDLDRPGARIGVGKAAAYDLFLSRTYTRAEFVRYPSSAAVFQGFLDDRLDAGAGIRQPVEAFAARTPGTRIIAEPFMKIQQAVAIPRAFEDRLPWFREALRDAKARGLIKEALARSGQDANLAAP